MSRAAGCSVGLDVSQSRIYCRLLCTVKPDVQWKLVYRGGRATESAGGVGREEGVGTGLVL